MTQPSAENPVAAPSAPPPPPMAGSPLPPPPLPVQPLAYGTPEQGRPGVLTAVGVLSVVFGSLAVLGAIGTAASVAVMQVMATSVSTTTTTTTTTTTGNTTTVQGGTTVTTTPGAAVFGGFRQSGWSTLLQLVEALVRAGLAALLVIAAICVFRDHPLGRKLHVIWALLRIPAAVVAAVLQWWVMNEMMAAMPPMPPTPGFGGGVFSWVSIVSAAATLLFACAYPVAVLVVMSTRTVKRYYEAELGARAG